MAKVEAVNAKALEGCLYHLQYVKTERELDQGHLKI